MIYFCIKKVPRVPTPGIVEQALQNSASSLKAVRKTVKINFFRTLEIKGL